MKIARGGLLVIPVLVLASCSNSGSTKATAPATTLPPISTGAPATPPPSTAASTTTSSVVPTTSAAASDSAPSSAGSISSAATTAPAATTSGIPAVGQTVTGAGSTLTAPAAPTTKTVSAACGGLTDSGYSLLNCVTSSSPGGTIAALTERSTSGEDVRDLVYRKNGAGSYGLVLRRDDATGKADTGLVESDLNLGDGDSKAVFSTPSTNEMFLQTLDVVDTSGVVAIHLNLDGGFARASTGGGLDAWFPATSGGYEHDILRFIGGQWRVISQVHESDTQAEPNNGGGFTP